MPAHLNGDVTPLRVQDMKGIMIDVGPRCLDHQLTEFARTGHLRLPNQCGRFGHPDQKKSWFPLFGGEIFLCDLVLALARRTVHYRDAIGFSPGPQAPAEPSRHAHEMIVIQILIGTVQGTPPSAKASPGLTHSEVGVQHDTIHAIITVLEKIAVQGTQLVRPAFRSITRARPFPQPLPESCPAGATFSERSLRKSVATSWRKIQFLTGSRNYVATVQRPDRQSP